MLPSTLIGLVGARDPLSLSSSSKVTDSRTTSSFKVPTVLFVRVIAGVSMEVGVVPLSAVALTKTSPLFALNSMSFIATLSGPPADLAGMLNTGFPSCALETVVLLPTRVMSLVMLTSDMFT